MNRRTQTVSLLALILVAREGAPVRAAFPGSNGRIVFSAQNAQLRRGDIYSTEPNGEGLVNLTDDQPFDIAPSVSPDGSLIVFASQRDGNREIYTMNADGTGIRRLTDDPAFDTQPAWSADGTRIVFSSDRANRGHGQQLYVMNADGSGVVQLTHGQGLADLAARWAPDGSRIAFARFPLVAGYVAIFTVWPDGTHIRPLTPEPLCGTHPDWSPDSQKIAFNTALCDENGGNIFVMSADGAVITPITHGFGNNFMPSWSPQGDEIAFSHEDCSVAARTCTFDADLFIMNSDGSGPRKITDRFPVFVNRAVWGPAR